MAVFLFPQEALHSQQELTETWTSQVRVLGSQLEKMVRLCEENASAAKAAQRQVVALQVCLLPLHFHGVHHAMVLCGWVGRGRGGTLRLSVVLWPTTQSEQGKGAVNEEALRTELAEAKGNLAACRGQLSRLHAQLAAAEDSQRARSMQQDVELRFRLGAAERELVGARQAEVAARAECERLRGELRAARDWQLETEVGLGALCVAVKVSWGGGAVCDPLSTLRPTHLPHITSRAHYHPRTHPSHHPAPKPPSHLCVWQSLEKEVSASRLAAASVQAMQHRMVRQLEVVTSQLDLSNKQRNALQAEVERLEGILADLRHQGP
jgi:hypothetical protein